MKTHDDNGNMIDHEPIDSFISDLDAIPTDEWRARTLAFESLVSTLPDAPMSNPGSGITPWYRSATALRRLNQPISSLLLDARSTVAKHTCQHLAFLVQRTQSLSPHNSDICKYLLKDLLPSILGLHAQTVKTIRVYAVDMIAVIIPACRFKSGLPVLLERLRKDKSRDVREGCVQYLHLILRHWTKDVYYASSSDQSAISSCSSGGESRRKKEDYLTRSICVHIGNGIARSLMDSSQSVRTEARSAFELFRLRYPELWNQIVQKQDGILSKDSRVRKQILTAAKKADAQGVRSMEDIPSGNSFEDDFDGVSVVSGGTQNSVNSWNSVGSFASRNSGIKQNYNKRSMSTGRNRTGFRSGPVRVPVNNSLKKLPPSGKRDTNSPPPPLAQCTATNHGTEPSIHFDKENELGSHNNDHIDDIDALIDTPTNVVVTNPVPNLLPFKPNNTTIAANPPLPQNSELLGSRRSSMLLQERLKGAEQARDVGNGTSCTNGDSSIGNAGDTVPTNENLMVAMQLLQAHKTYIDELMENLRCEMNVVRDFELVVTRAKREREELSSTYVGDGASAGGISNGIHPSEDEVLGYFETVYGFLDKGTENGVKLRQAMDKVSLAEYQPMN